MQRSSKIIYSKWIVSSKIAK